jgi:lipid II:glycine glycyltransferase (peptidoglycan interpeptide bridge formation enzyme)
VFAFVACFHSFIVFVQVRVEEESARLRKEADVLREDIKKVQQALHEQEKLRNQVKSTSASPLPHALNRCVLS